VGGVLLPLVAVLGLVGYERQLLIGGGVSVFLAGVYLRINRRQPRALARGKPTRLALWSFLAAMARGAGLMLVPLYLGLCEIDALDAGHRAANSLMTQNMRIAFMVALAHTAAMTVAGGLVAWGVYTWLGLKFLSKAWFNMDVFWALSLVAVGGIGVWMAL